MNARTTALAVVFASMLGTLAGCASSLQPAAAANTRCTTPQLCFAVPAADAPATAAASDSDRPTRSEEEDEMPLRTYAPLR
jgi:hypothetical protein